MEHLSKEIVEQIIESYFNKNQSSKSFNHVCDHALQALGIKANLKGYSYLKYCIKLAVHKEEHHLIKQLYATTAKKYKTTFDRVERNCRHAIEVGFAHADAETYQFYFGSKQDKKPTNAHFIFTLAAKISEIIEGAML